MQTRLLTFQNDSKNTWHSSFDPLTLMITFAMSPNSPSQGYKHPEDHSSPTYDMTPAFKPFTIGAFYKGGTGQKIGEP